MNDDGGACRRQFQGDSAPDIPSTADYDRTCISKLAHRRIIRHRSTPLFSLSKVDGFVRVTGVPGAAPSTASNAAGALPSRAEQASCMVEEVRDGMPGQADFAGRGPRG